MPGWMNNKLELRLPGEINNLRYADDITVMAEREEELKSLLMRVKEESEMLDENSTFIKLKLWYPVPLIHGKQKGKKWKQ